MGAKVNQGLPPGIGEALESSIEAAAWLTPTDLAAVQLARRLGHALDLALDSGDFKEVPALAARFIAILSALHLTVETRIAGKKDIENDGTQHVENYLRVINAANN